MNTPEISAEAHRLLKDLVDKGYHSFGMLVVTGYEHVVEELIKRGFAWHSSMGDTLQATDAGREYCAELIKRANKRAAREAQQELLEAGFSR